MNRTPPWVGQVTTRCPRSNTNELKAGSCGESARKMFDATWTSFLRIQGYCLGVAVARDTSRQTGGKNDLVHWKSCRPLCDLLMLPSLSCSLFATLIELPSSPC
ncbi:hypothetical protein GN956_G22513 [Arapaima gigas]